MVLDFSSMGKGEAWVNGHHIGRYWTLVAPKDGCQETCDYRGAYGSEKCNTNCGNPTQIWYSSFTRAFMSFFTNPRSRMSPYLSCKNMEKVGFCGFDNFNETGTMFQDHGYSHQTIYLFYLRRQEGTRLKFL